MGGAKEYYQEQLELEERKILFQDLIYDGYLDSIPEDDDNDDDDDELILVKIAKKVIEHDVNILSKFELNLFKKHIDIFGRCSVCDKIHCSEQCPRCESNLSEALNELALHEYDEFTRSNSSEDMLLKVQTNTLKENIVYFLKSDDYIKIGTTRDLSSRVSNLQTGNPIKIDIIGSIPGSYLTEKSLHSLLKSYREFGEWFKVEPYIIELIRILLNPEDNIQVKSKKLKK